MYAKVGFTDKEGLLSSHLGLRTSDGRARYPYMNACESRVYGQANVTPGTLCLKGESRVYGRANVAPETLGDCERRNGETLSNSQAMRNRKVLLDFVKWDV